MHIHILGICGTFMGGLAVLARSLGHKVTGCDAGVYPPMSTQLEAAGITLIEGYDKDQTKLAPDFFVVGNAISRGNPLLEEILNRNLPFVSGPEWLANNVLASRWVLGVAGTHGKTTTASMIAWILEEAGLSPGFLIGGVPNNFGISARLQGDKKDSPFFVIEADEYDSAFCDKRSKFIHYRPRTLVLNNLEFDHADIFDNLAAIETQFHHLVRTIPNEGLIIWNAAEESLQRVLARACFTPCEAFNTADSWHMQNTENEDNLQFMHGQIREGTSAWQLSGAHNRANAAAALLAARHVGVTFADGLRALSTFKNVKRRMELKGEASGIFVYDDFAHHPTAIFTTIEGLRKKQANGRILAVLEPRSNTMKLGAMKRELPDSLRLADKVFCYAANLGWDAAEALQPINDKSFVSDDLTALINKIAQEAQTGDHILVMSNGGFGGIHDKLLSALAK